MLNTLGALLKYEFRFYLRFLPPLYLLLLVVTLILRLQSNYTVMDNMGMGQANLFLVLYLFCTTTTVAILVITLVHIIQRFINNFIKDQGAFTFTLPVTIWTLLTAKVIAAFCMTLMSIVAVYFSIFFFSRGMESAIFSIWSDLIRIPVPNSGEIMIIVFVACAMIVHQICLIYMAITVSHLLPRFRFIAGIGIYLAVPSFLEKPVFIFANKNMSLNFVSLQDSLYRFAYDNDFYLALIPSGIASLVFIALYFWATGFLLKRTFNLE
jgi:hypothetical protein